MWSVQRVPTTANFGFLDRSRYFFIQVVNQLSSRGWTGPVPDPPPLGKSGSAGIRTRDPWICCQDLWPLEHWDGQLNTTNCNSTWHPNPANGVHSQWRSNYLTFEVKPSPCDIIPIISHTFRATGYKMNCCCSVDKGKEMQNKNGQTKQTNKLCGP
jgi:hypothetical protein